MQISFTKTTRKMLRRSLEAHGCPRASGDIIDGFENLVRKHFGIWIVQGHRPALYSAAQAMAILQFGNHICDELDSLVPATERRMARELNARAEEMSLPEYGDAVHDVCMISIYAMERSMDLVLRPKASVDYDLKCLCDAVIQEWKRVTCNPLPEFPQWKQDWSVHWEDVRQLQQHPLWIVMDAIGIRMNLDLTSWLADGLEGGDTPAGSAAKLIEA